MGDSPWRLEQELEQVRVQEQVLVRALAQERAQAQAQAREPAQGPVPELVQAQEPVQVPERVRAQEPVQVQERVQVPELVQARAQVPERGLAREQAARAAITPRPGSCDIVPGPMTLRRTTPAPSRFLSVRSSTPIIAILRLNGGPTTGTRPFAFGR